MNSPSREESLEHLLKSAQEVRASFEFYKEENRKLREDNIRMARALSEISNSKDHLKLEPNQLESFLDDKTELESRLLSLEEMNNSIMSMFVASFQLHATLDAQEVVNVVEEIVVNFIGASAFAIFTRDEEGAFDVVKAQRVDEKVPRRVTRPSGVFADIIESGRAYIHNEERPAREGILAAVPFVIKNECLGALLVFELLEQKERLLNNDVEMLSVLGGHTASALLSARHHSRSSRKLKTLEGMLTLLEPAT